MGRQTSMIDNDRPISAADERALTATIKELQDRAKGSNGRLWSAVLDDVRAGDFTFTRALAAKREAEDDETRIELARIALGLKDWEPPPAGR